MSDTTEKIYSKIIAIIIVAITIAITTFCLIILLDVKQIREDLKDLRILDQMKYERLFIADPHDFEIK